MNTKNNYEREQGEPREQLNIGAFNSCSQKTKYSENNENILIASIKRPCFASYETPVIINKKLFKPGLYYHSVKIKNEEMPEEINTWISSPLEILAITSTASHEDFGRLLKFVDSNGKWHEWAMPMHLLKGRADELLGALLSQGLICNLKFRKELIEYIMNAQPERRITAVNTTGWHNTSFILPNEVIGTSDIIYQSEIVTESDFSTSGTLEEWVNNIGKFCEDNIPLIVSISVALAGPLLNLVHHKHGGGIHWVGDSSTGKSTALEVATSIWGPSDFIRSWRVTSNGFEGFAASRNDTCIILDEINEGHPEDIGMISYMIINGQGKQRAGKVGNAKKIQRWRLTALSSGEKTLESIIKEGGKRINSGQAVRLLNIPVRFEYGIFNNLHNFTDGRALAEYFQTMTGKYYGNAGRQFIQKLIFEKKNLPELLNIYTQEFVKNAKQNIEKRAAVFFSLISLAGELAIEYGILPIKKGDAFIAAQRAFLIWKKFQGVYQTEDYKIIQAISNFIDKYGDTRFSSIDEEKHIPDRAGWYKIIKDERIHMFLPAAIDEVVDGFERSRVIDVLNRGKFIIEKDIGRHTKKIRTNSGLKNVYSIHIGDILEDIE